MEKATKSKKAGSRTTNSNTENKSHTENKKARTTSQPAKRQMQMGEELEQLFLDTLKDIYYAEKALTKALPKMAKASTTEELAQAFEEHLAQTQEHINRLEKVFELMGQKAEAKKCDAMDGLQKEAESVIEETAEGSLTRDVGLIISAQKVEHYEIATYGSLASLANTFGMSEIADLLQQTLEEEKETDDNLTYIAENNINFPAGIEDQSDTAATNRRKDQMEDEEEDEA